MLYLLISCVSFILLSKSFTPKPIQKWVWEHGKLKFLPLGFFWDGSPNLFLPICLKLKKMKAFSSSSRGENVVEERESSLSLLDLPDLTLECILERLSPSGLCSMRGVCASLREMCKSDHFWEKHMEQKWGRIIGAAAHREWQLHVVSSTTRITNSISHKIKTNKKGLFESLVSGILPFSWIRPRLATSAASKVKPFIPLDSIMSLYLSLESGKFWFPAQVYNRENGNVGFMLSCYDAQLSYDSRTNTFQARYLPYGRRATEENIPWDRLRAAPVDTPSHKLHVSDCLHDLKPGDHMEIQWRRNKEFPYGWWYGVVAHFELCDGNENHCRCHYRDIVVLEFSQYTPGSRWRQMTINRKEHREEGNEADGFYGGIRKLYNEEEIERWKRLWPAQVLD